MGTVAMIRPVVVFAAALFAVGAESEPLFRWLVPWGSISPTESSVNGSILETKVSDVVRYLPYLTEDDFARADSIDDRALAESYPDDDGGPLKSNGTMEVVGRRVWQLWANGKIPYKITGKFGQDDRASISRAIKYLEKVSCLRFKPAPPGAERPLMEFLANDGPKGKIGCKTAWALEATGMYAYVNLPPRSSCTVPRTIAHEILHGVGMYHTHMRPDRDDFVTINMQNVRGKQKSQFKKCDPKHVTCDTHGHPYDCDSVMHYASNQMSKNGKDTITSKKSSCKLLPFTQWNAKKEYLSPKDIAFLKRQYGNC